MSVMTAERLNDSQVEGLGRYSGIITRGVGDTALAPLVSGEDVSELLARIVTPTTPETQNPFDSVTECGQPAFLTGTPGVEAPSIEALIRGIVSPTAPGSEISPFDAVTESTQSAFLVES